jgi:hypothetical protein
VPYKDIEKKREYDRKRSSYKGLGIRVGRIGNYIFSGNHAKQTRENEDVILQNRLLKLERIAIKARVKSLTWLGKYTK